VHIKKPKLINYHNEFIVINKLSNDGRRDHLWWAGLGMFMY
jgi:hypothetical protein